MNTTFWSAKLAAWVHDPAEKALVLFSGKAHEKGTVRELCNTIFGTGSVPTELAEHVTMADHWAAAADRPALPWRPGERYPEWAKVSFTKSPELVHPVSPGMRVKIRETFSEIDVSHVEAVSMDHFKKLVVRDKAAADMRKTFVRFWRFGPETPAEGLNNLWRVLPADTRSPDHTIWDHLKLCSALAGVFALGQAPALLVVSLGPVQGFIAQARSTSDLWAGSHLLSQMSWQAMKPLCEEYGPDSVLFPDLRGIPVVDQWLDESGLWPEDIEKPWEENMPLDRDPRMAASLPNRFVAVVPEQYAAETADKIKSTVRGWVNERARLSARHLFGKELPEAASEQIKEQFKDFPEVYWSLVPWSMVKDSGGKADAEALLQVISEFLPEGAGPSEAAEGTWDILSRPLVSASGEWRLFEPNRGTAYTHLYRLADHLHGSAKSLRHFGGMKQEGYRCTICGEREWLTDDRKRLSLSSGKREGTPWAKAEARLVRKGEHLCAWCTLKRFWPSVFPESVGPGGSRYVVSTHTMALAPSIEKVVDDALKGKLTAEARNSARQLALSTKGIDRAAFPRRLWRKLGKLRKDDEEMFAALTRLPVLLDCISDDANIDDAQEQELSGKIRKVLNADPETYYALLLMDGDYMGAWLSGSDGKHLPYYRDILHSRTADALNEEFWDDEGIRVFLDSKRPNTPARHQAISRALNSFSLHLARIVVEDVFTGKLIYAGGDDLLAMVSVRDLPGLMLALRCLYSGVLLDRDEAWKALTGRAEQPGIILREGYAYLRKNKHLYSLMGSAATASIGAVIAHHKAPLGRVLRSLRAAERSAKERGGRDAFCLTLEKRSGGTTTLVGKWTLPPDGSPKQSTLGALIELRNLLSGENVSRRAVYILAEVLRDVPEEPGALDKVIAYQLERQGAKDGVADLAEKLAALSMQNRDIMRNGELDVPPANAWLRDFLITAEFLARESRAAEGGDGE